MSDLAAAAREALAEGGALADAIPAFVPRASQQRLSAAVADAFDSRGTLLAEAGTGTGKTYAYLVPALLSGQKTIISTGTRALQDQLFLRDLPRVRDALGTPIKTALLKGRANYLCKHRLERAKGEPRFANREQIAQFQRIVSWSGRTRMGDMAELDALPEDSPLLPMVTSTAENCLGSECPFWSDCFVVQARARAQAADIVVVNHHLLLADLALKQEGFGEILPGAQAFVVDEAHQLPDLAAQFFGEGVGARPLVELARDAIAECKDVSASIATVQGPAQQLEHATRVLRAAMEVLPTRGTRGRALQDAPVREACVQLIDAVAGLRRCVGRLARSLAGLRSVPCAGAGFRGAVEALGRVAECRRISRKPASRTKATCSGSSCRRAASVCNARRSTSPARCAITACVRTPRGCSPRRRCRSPAASITCARAWASTIRKRCSNPAPSTGMRRRCATCRRACPSRCRATTARPSSMR